MKKTSISILETLFPTSWIFFSFFYIFFPNLRKQFDVVRGKLEPLAALGINFLPLTVNIRRQGVDCGPQRFFGVNFRPLGFDFSPLVVDFGLLEVHFLLRLSILGLWK